MAKELKNVPVKGNINWRAMGKYTAVTAQIYFPPLCSYAACCAHCALLL